MAVVISLPLFGPPGRELDEGTNVDGRRLRVLAEQLGERLEKAAVTLDRLRADGWSAKAVLYDVLLARKGIETREEAERYLRSLNIDPEELILIEELDEDSEMTWRPPSGETSGIIQRHAHALSDAQRRLTGVHGDDALQGAHVMIL